MIMIFQSVLKEILFSLDLFKTPFTFTFSEKHSKLDSKTGILFSLIIYIFMMLMFFQSDYYHKTNPKVISQTIPWAKTEKMTFNKDNFILTVGIVNIWGEESFLDPSIGKFKVEYVDVNVDLNLTKNITYNEKKIHHCNFTDFTKDEFNMTKVGYFHFTCLDDLNFEIEGFLNQPSSKMLSITLDKL